MGGLAGNVVEFRGGRSRAKTADAHAVGLDLFGEAFGKEQIEAFRGSVDRNEGHGLKRGRGGHDEHIAAAAFDHRRKIKPREKNNGGAVHLDHVEEALRIEHVKLAVDAKAGVIDEKIDLNCFLRREGEDRLRCAGIGEVGCGDFRLNAIPSRE